MCQPPPPPRTQFLHRVSKATFVESGLGDHHSVAVEEGRPAHSRWDGSLVGILDCICREEELQ